MSVCSSCGNQISADVRFCPKCGKELLAESDSRHIPDKARQERSRVWYLMPIFFAIVGGIIAYFALKNDNKKLAKNCLWLGIIFTILGIVFEAVIVIVSNDVINHFS